MSPGNNITYLCSNEFLRLRKVTEKRIRNVLHVDTLNTYLAAAVAPKGLRIIVKPAVGRNIARWDSILTNASLQLTRVVLDHYRSSSKKFMNQESQIAASLNLSSSQSAALEARIQKME